MMQEAPNPGRTEVGKSADFYVPITDPAKTLEQLNLLSQKEPTDQELFEGITNTFATIARMDFEQEVVFEDGAKALDWTKTDEVWMKESEERKVVVGYYQGENSPELPPERSFIEFSEDQSNDSFNFEKRGQAIRVVKVDYSLSDEEVEHVLDSNERKAIIKALSEGLNSRLASTPK